MRLKHLRLLLLAGLIFCGWPAAAHAEAELNKPAPELVAKQLDGKSFKLADQQGKVVIVNFWATWCPPCRDEMPLLNTIFKHYRGHGLVMIGVSADREKHRSDVVQAMKGLDYPAALMSDAETNGFGWMAQLPVTYIIDKQGIVRVKFDSDPMPLSEKSLIQLLEPLLAK